MSNKRQAAALKTTLNIGYKRKLTYTSQDSKNTVVFLQRKPGSHLYAGEEEVMKNNTLWEEVGGKVLSVWRQKEKTQQKRFK